MRATRPLVLWLCNVTLLLGCGAQALRPELDSADPSGVAGTGSSSEPASSPPVPEPIDSEPRHLCDGSDEARFVLASRGGFVDEFYGFYAPLGPRFLVIDGQCNYSSGYAGELGEIRSGRLLADRAAQIESQLSYARLADFVGDHDGGCISEGAATVLRSPGSRIVCPCGCQDNPQLRGIFQAASALTDELFDGGTASDGALSVLMVEEPAEFVASPRNMLWPLEWDPATRFSAVDPSGGGFSRDSGFRVESSAERQALRALRDTSRSASSSDPLGSREYVPMSSDRQTSTVYFRVYLRDDASAEVEASIRSSWLEP